MNNQIKNISILFLFTIIFLFCFNSNSFSQDKNWMLITSSSPMGDGRYFNYYVDTTSVKYSDKNGIRICSCRIKNEYIKDKKIAYIIENNEINCAEVSKTTISATVYYLNGTNYSADLNDKQYPKPGTSGEWIINILCDK